MGRISRYCPHLIVRVDDYRLAFGTPAQKRAVAKQIKKRSDAAKLGWAKRRAKVVSTNGQVLSGDAK